MPTALIVEDEPEANQLLSLLVQIRGYQTESAYTGGEALESVRRRRPDIVFLDLMLPDINGYDVCRALKGRRQTNLIPIVMVTARLADENRLLSFRLGANEFIPKPYTPDQIFDALEAADSWRREIERQADEGQILLDTGGEEATFEQVARFLSLLLARTAWEEEAIRQLGLDLNGLAQHVLAWGRLRGVDRPAAIRYELHPDRITLVVDDLAGWSSCEDLPNEEGLGLLIGRGRFDDVTFDASDNRVTLTKRLPRGGR